MAASTTSASRAAFADLWAGRVVEGGSTLEQELARNLYLGNDKRTFSWKLKQACLMRLAGGFASHRPRPPAWSERTHRRGPRSDR